MKSKTAIKDLNEEELIQYLYQKIEKNGNYNNEFLSSSSVRKKLTCTLQRSTTSVIKVMDHIITTNKGQQQKRGKVQDEGDDQYPHTIIMKMKDKNGCNVLHHALQHGACDEIITKIISIGGKEIVMEKDDKSGKTSLHFAFQSTNCSKEILLRLIEIGGQKLIMEADNFGRTVLNTRSDHIADTAVLLKLIEMGR